MIFFTEAMKATRLLSVLVVACAPSSRAALKHLRQHGHKGHERHKDKEKQDSGDAETDDTDDRKFSRMFSLDKPRDTAAENRVMPLFVKVMQEGRGAPQNRSGNSDWSLSLTIMILHNSPSSSQIIAPAI